ncbi:S8 family serine peptidase [Archangium lansingense]|uniref:S8 family serine peptidase n=1 Tax=Archangium lansingense TaxID=2995310 RepID=A0ABT4AHJ4_9BACT|nr:S8 family serine peptidase [Archangium lansinium]MCY1081056.1 S8 family serine peptidase [Archangium lansinium]
MLDSVRKGQVGPAAGLVGLTVLLLVLQGCERPEAAGEKGYVEGELLVRFREPALTSAQSALHSVWGAEVVHSYESIPGLQVIRLPEGADLEQALAAYRKDPRVLQAGYNAVYSSDNVAPVVPDDPLFGSLWGLKNTGQDGGVAGADIGATQAWSLTTGSEEVVLAVIDSGLDYTHPDLAANVWVNPGEIAGNGLDDDNNGYVDDVHGINAITGTGDPMDDGNHGTHVAGILGAVGNNEAGISGVNWKAKIVACKFLDKSGNGTEANALKCMDYLLRLKQRAQNPVNIVATNNSWSCRLRTCNSELMRSAILKHQEAGMLFVAAAGNVNANIDSAESWPAKYQLPNMLVVAATDRKDARWNLSSYGPHTVHLAAPGVDIVSTVPGNAYRSFNGTSMASPHVVGVAGLLAAQEPTRDWRAIKNLLMAGARPVPGLSGVTMTGRRLRAWGPDGSGALNCENQIVTQRLSPLATSGRVATVVGFPLPISVLNIRCAEPAGAVSVSVAGHAESLVSLSDDGQGGDLAAGDGVYSGHFAPARPGTYTLTFPGGEVLTVDVLNPYVPAETRPFTYEAMTGANIRVDGASDETTSVIPVPFPIRFADVSSGFSTLYVNSNGYIAFAPVPSASANSPLPSTFFQTAILPLWQNLEVPGVEPSGLYYETLGTEPNRKFVIEWRDVAIAPIFPVQPLKFQVVFFENSSDIAFNYAQVFYGDPDYPELDNGGSATVGIQLLPTVVQQFSHMEPVLTDGTSLLFRTVPSPNVPVVTAPAVTNGPPAEGRPVSVQASFSVANGEDGPWKIEWSCHYDGVAFVPEQESFASVQGSVSHACDSLSQGDYRVALRVTGQSGEASPVQWTAFTVADVSPKVLSFTATPSSGNVPLVVDFSVSATTGAADGTTEPVVGYAWDFEGDGTFEETAVSTARHTYPGSGTFTARVRVLDRDSHTEAEVQVVVGAMANRPPTIDSSPPNQTAWCGALYTYQLVASDPDGDTLSFSLLQPPLGMTINASTGLIRWTPIGLQCGWKKDNFHTIKVQVSDGLGGVDTQEFSVNARTRAVLTVPQLVEPVGDALAGSTPLTFTVLNVPHPTEEPFTYDFEFLDVTEGDRVVHALLGIQEQPDGRTSVTLSGEQLVQGRPLAWRARAVSVTEGAGEWSAPLRFLLREQEPGKGQPLVPEEGRAGCGAMPGASAPSHLLLLLALTGVTRWRPRRGRGAGGGVGG